MPGGSSYSCVFAGVAVTLAQDFFEILAPTTGTVEILSCKITQSSDPADAEAEQLPIEFVIGKGTVTSGSGGTAGVEEPLGDGAAAAAVVEINNTTKMVVGTGSLHIVDRESFNVQIGLYYTPLELERICLAPGDRMTVELVSAPSDSLTMDGTLKWREWGQ